MSGYSSTFPTDGQTSNGFEQTHTVSQSHQGKTFTITPSTSRRHLPTPPKTPSRTEKRSSAQLKTPKKVIPPQGSQKSTTPYTRQSSACKACRISKRHCSGNWAETCETCARTGKDCTWDDKLKGAKISKAKAYAKAQAQAQAEAESGSLLQSVHTIMTPEARSMTPTENTAMAIAVPSPSSSSIPFQSAIEQDIHRGLDFAVANVAAANPTFTGVTVDRPRLRHTTPIAFTTPMAVPAPIPRSMPLQFTPEDLVYGFGLSDGNFAATPFADTVDARVDRPRLGYITPMAVPAPISSGMPFQFTPEEDLVCGLGLTDGNLAANHTTLGFPAVLDDPPLSFVGPTTSTTAVPAPVPSSEPLQPTSEETIHGPDSTGTGADLGHHASRTPIPPRPPYVDPTLMLPPFIPTSSPGALTRGVNVDQSVVLAKHHHPEADVDVVGFGTWVDLGGALEALFGVAAITSGDGNGENELWGDWRDVVSVEA